MSTIVLGCDLNNSNDHNVQNTVEKILKKAGHTVEKLAVDSNAFASASYKKSNKGKIGVYLMAGSVYSVADFEYGSTQFKYAYFGIRGDASPSIRTENDFKTKKIKPDSDCTSVCNKLAYKTYPQMNEQCKRCVAVFGKTGEELGNNILKAMGGEATSSSSDSNSVSDIKTCIQEVLYNWNGDAYCYLRDDTVYIGRIPEPTSAKLSLIEDENVYLNSISLTDINPNTPNKLIIKWGDYEFSIQDDNLIKRFGEKKKTVKSTKKSEKDTIDFAYREWNKLLKDSGRVLECKVPGHPKWRIGEWVRVYIPSFNLNGYMWITKVSHNDGDGGKWEVGLSLVDYPPDLGKEPSQKADESANSDSSSSDSNSNSNSTSNSS